MSLMLKHLKVTNFRCFTELEIDFHERMTVLVAENGSGKTATVAAASLALSAFSDVFNEAGLATIDRDDVHLVADAKGRFIPSPPCTVGCTATISGEDVTWSICRNSVAPGSRGRRPRDGKPISDVALALGERVLAYSQKKTKAIPTLPVLCKYGTARLWQENAPIPGKNPTGDLTSRIRGYDACLTDVASIRGFSSWYGNLMWRAGRAPRSSRKQTDRPELLLAAVNDAVRTVLEPSGWNNLGWDSEAKELTVEHPERGTIPFWLTSDGVRSMVALVGDLAHRCARLNPQFEDKAALHTPGIVLIDEVDMHLHPAWQQRVLELLVTAFPKVQFVVTTHSPQVLSTVNADRIRVIKVRGEQSTVTIPTFQTRGVESADVLSTIMGVDPIPQVEEARRLNEYRALIEEGKAESADALALRVRLLDHFGANHPVMLDCDRLIRFQAIKLRRRDSAPKVEPA